MSRVLTSIMARSGADEMMQSLNDGRLMLEVLPNTYEQYRGDLESENYVSYCNFLSSRNGRNVLCMLDELDEGDDVGDAII